MTTRYYHTPPQPVSTRVRCPVCHEEVYSRAGIHPQCAARQFDRLKPKDKPREAPGTAEQAGDIAEPAAALADPPIAGGVSASDHLSA